MIPLTPTEPFFGPARGPESATVMEAGIADFLAEFALGSANVVEAYAHPTLANVPLQTRFAYSAVVRSGAPLHADGRLALHWQIQFTPQSRADPSSAVRAALKRSMMRSTIAWRTAGKLG